MTRELKFRAWIPDYNEMVILENTGVQKFDCENGLSAMFTADNYTEIWAHENYGVVKNAILMQYTGLKDKNGKEIYEGDIVQTVAHDGTRLSKSKIIWSESRCRFMKHTEDDCFFDLETSQNFLEVIGNIYETPDDKNKNRS